MAIALVLSQRSHDVSTFSPQVSRSFQDALRQITRHQSPLDALARALRAICAESHEHGYSAEYIVIARRETWQRIPRPAGWTDDEWHDVHLGALNECLTMYVDWRAG